MEIDHYLSVTPDVQCDSSEKVSLENKLHEDNKFTDYDAALAPKSI